MIRTLAFVPTLIALFVLTVPSSGWADVIPTAPAQQNAGLQKTIQDRGIEVPDARSLARAVTAEDAAYFASAPERVQVVGGILFEEWAGAMIGAVGIPVATYLLLRAVDIYGD